jgi:hypothetical protein
MSIIIGHRRPVKVTRRTPRPDAPFGAGILRFAPYGGTMPYNVADLEWAAQEFGRDADWDARLAADANGEECHTCGRPVERGELEGGLCNVCQCRAEESTMACLYSSAGMGWKSY